MKIRIYKPIVFLILIFHAAFIDLPYVEGYGLFKYISLVMVGVFLILQYRTFKKHKFKEVNLWMILYATMVVISSFVNKDGGLERNVFGVAIIFAITIIEVFFLFEYFVIKGRMRELITTLYYLLLIYCVLTDVVMVLFPTLHIEKGMYYFTGNKFTISYLHLQLLIVYLQKEKYIRHFGKVNMKDIMFMILSIFSFIVCINVECTTGMIGIILLVAFYYFIAKKGKTLKKPQIFIGILVISVSVLFLFSGVLQMEPIRYVVEEIFHRDISLTGRLDIYEKIDSVFLGHVLFGYGMGSSFEVVMKMIGAPNTQNGVLEIILQQGILSLILFIVLVWKIFKYVSRRNNINYALIMLYIYALFASVEITLDISFIIWLGLALVFEEDFEMLNCHKENRLNGKDNCEKCNF